MSKRGFTLIETIIVIAIVATLLAIAGPPFMAMLRRSSVEESAQRLQEAVKSAQIEAQKRGDVEFGNISTATGITVGNMKRTVFLALYPTSNMLRVIAWNDKNIDGIRTNDEFTIIQETSLGAGTTFSVPPTINKKACSNTAGAPADSIVNFTFTGSPIGETTLFPLGTKYIKLNGKGFSESMQNVSAYISNNTGETFAVTISPAGLTELCRWDNTNWLILR